MTVISSASAITWLLVTMLPDRIDDEAGAERGLPSPRRRVGRSPSRRGCGSKKSLKNSSNGEPGGNCGICGCWSGALCAAIVVEEEMLTTAGSSLAARSAKLAGASLASAGAAAANGSAAGSASAVERAIARRVERMSGYPLLA